MKTINNQNGIALILVLGVLAVLVILATTFAFNMRLEQKAASNYLDSVNVDCIARIGIEYAISLLHNDITESSECQGYDWNGDDWGHLDTSNGIFNADGGTDQNLDDYSSTTSGSGYAGADSKWIDVTHDGVLVGRYAVLVLDESSKMNINAAGNIANAGNHGANEGWTTSEIDLDALPDITSAISNSIVEYRYGANDEPGAIGDDDEDDKDILEYDGIDNDGDGLIDSADTNEGDDEPDEYNSWSLRDDDDLFSTTTQIKRVSGITDSIWDSVKNIITVNSRTRNQYWDGSNWQDKININAVANIDELYNAIDGLGIANLSQKTCNIIDYRDENYILSTLSKVGTVYGVEPILINEVLCRSYLNWGPAVGWNSGNIGDAWAGPFDFSSAVATSVAPNTYYKVRINAPGGAGRNPSFDVKVGQPGAEGADQTINTGETDYTDISKCRSNSSGNLSFWLKDVTLDDGLTSLISQVFLTCAEAVELYNISAEGIDLTGWKIDSGDGNFDTIPAGKYYNGATTNTISAGGSFVITNDEELFARSYGEGDAIWGNNASETIPVAIIPGWTDGYKTSGELAEDGAIDIVILNAYNQCVELADSNTGQCGGAAGSTVGVSREKDDPTMRSDWAYNTKATAQTSLLYENDRVSGTLSDIYIKTYPFASIGEIADTTNVAPNFYKGVRSGDVAWQAIQGAASGDDLGLIAERITTDAVRLDAETADGTDAGTVGAYWSAAASGPYLTESCVSSSGSSDTSYWEWRAARLQPISHVLYIYGLYFNDDDYLDIYVSNYTGTTLTFPGTATAENREYQPSDGLKVGTIGTSNIGSDGRFAIKLVTDGTQSSDVYFDYLLLVPKSVPGKVNLNTAALKVLEGLPGLSVAAAQAIYSSVHTDPEDPYPDLGYVLDDITEAQFSPISNLVTVHSDVFQIICLAQALDPIGEVAAEKKIKVIVDRSGLPSSALKILSWEEIRN